MIRAIGLALIVVGAAVVAMDPALLPAVDVVGKGIFAAGALAASARGVGHLPARLRGPLLVPLALLAWVWASAAAAGRAAHLLAAAELSLPIATVMLLGVQCWPDRTWRVLSVVGCVAVASVAMTGLIRFSTVLNYGAFAHPNGFGGTMLFLSVFPVLCLERGALVTRAFGALSLLAVLVMTVVSSSRGSLAALVVFLGLSVYLRSGRLARAGLMMAVLGLVAAGVAAIGGLATAELNDVSMRLFGKNLDTGRMGMWTLLIATSLQRPLLGYGPGGSFSEFNEGLSAHSVYFQALFDSGVPALALLLLFVLVGLRALRVGVGADRQDKVLRTGLAFFVAVAVHGLIEVSWFGNFLPGTFVFWPIAGLLLARSSAALAT